MDAAMWHLLDEMAQMDVRLTSALAGRRGERPPRGSTSSCSDGSAPSYLATTREAANRAPALEPVVHRRRQALAVASDVEQEPSGGVTNEEAVAAHDSLAKPPEQRLQHNTHGTSIAPLPTATSSSTTCPWATSPRPMHPTTIRSTLQPPPYHFPPTSLSPTTSLSSRTTSASALT
jgi:hypothetical protein